MDTKSNILSLLNESYALRINNLEQSIALALEALSLSRNLNDAALVAKSLSLLSLFSMIKGDYDDSLQMAGEAIELYGELNDNKGLADAKYNIAAVYYKTNNYHLGLIHLVDCITIYRAFNDYHSLSKSLKAIGTIYEYFGNEKKAIKTYQDAIAAAQEAGDLNLESNAYNNLSGVYIKQGDIEKASDLIERAINIKNQTGDLRGLAFSLYGRGKVNLAQGNFKQAELDFTRSVELHHEMGETVGLGMAYHKMGNLYLQMNLKDKAIEILNKGVEFSTKSNVVMVRYKCYFLFYQLYKSENDPVNALKYLELYHKEKDSVINKQTLKIIENYELIKKIEDQEKEAELQKAEMMKKKDIAEQTAKIKQDFLSTISHEIRTPLNAVIAIASLLDDRVNNDEQELVDTLRFSANNLLLIINDFLDFTKLDAGKAKLELRPANIKTLFVNIKNTYDSLAKEKGIQLFLTVDDSVSEQYELDETKISQIVGNLITNSIKFTENGSINVSVKKVKGELGTDWLRFEVADTGSGIDAQYVESIFESFYQPRTITTRKEGGTGLGLAIVKKLVALHGGEIHVDTTLGKGSTFYFELPLKKAIVSTPEINSYSDWLKGKTVLLAEDNAINAMLTRKLLSNFKMTSELAKNGLEAVDMSRQKSYDFILMDIHMPEMDGFEATRNIRTLDNYNSNTPIFALTADITAESKEEFRHLFNGFLSKPIEISKIHDALVSCLREPDKQQ